MNLHPGVVTALRLLGGDELTVAELMALGELTSPQTYHNITFYNIRITGTGVSYRPSLDEFVYRKPENYLTDRFLQRCNGLPVIMHHPEGALLNSEEFASRVVGTITKAYIRDDDVWAIARLYDEDAIKEIKGKQLSTSPAVLLEKSEKLTLEDGGHLLVEGKAELLDHIAICSVGVWDKGEGPTGIETTVVRKDSVMAEDTEKEKADAARADAEKRMDEKFDMILKGIDSTRADIAACNSRMDAWEEKEKKKADAEKEEKKEETAEEKDKAKQLAADKAKKDAEDEMMADKAKKDAEEKEKEEKKKADSIATLEAQNRDLARKFEELTKTIRQGIPDSLRSELAKVQSRADDVFVQFGERAPMPLMGESSIDYRRRLIGQLAKHSDRWKDKRVDSLDEGLFSEIENQVYADAVVRARTPNDIPMGRLRQIGPVRNETGHMVTTFVGNDAHFVRGFTRPAGRVSLKSFYTGRDR